MKELFLSVLTISLTCSLLLAPLLLFASKIHSRYTAKTLYFVWLALGLRMALPFSFSLSKAPMTVQVPSYTLYTPVAAPVVSVPAAIGTVASAPSVGTAPVVTARPLDFVAMLAILWAVGAAVFLLWNAGAYLLARRRLLKSAEYLGDNVYQSPLVSTPMVIGLFRSIVLAPEGGADSLALRHEFCHIKRRDLWYKAFFLLVNAVHWFNPLAWLLAREAGRNVELCCDDDVLRNADATERKAYSRLLLSAAAGGNYPVLSTQFGSGKKQLRERLQNLFRKKKNSAALVALVLIAALLAGGLVACESSEGKKNQAGVLYDKPISAQASADTTEFTAEAGAGDVLSVCFENKASSPCKVILYRYGLLGAKDAVLSVEVAPGEKEEERYTGGSGSAIYYVNLSALGGGLVDGTVTVSQLTEDAAGASPRPTATADTEPMPGNIDINERIPELLGIICTPGASSNPVDYIETHRVEYDELLSYGEATLNYCGKQFERGAAIDLEGAVMAYLCCDLLGIDSQTVAECVTGQYWHTVHGIPYRTDSATGERTYYIPTGNEVPESTAPLSEDERKERSAEEYKEWRTVGDALSAVRERYSPLEGRRVGDYYVLAANQRWPDEVISPEPPSAVLMVKENGEWRVDSWMDSAKVGTTGFSAAVLHAGGMTMVVGDLGGKLARNEDTNDLVSPRYVDIVVDTDQGKYGTNAPGGTYFLMTLDGTLDVTDVHFSEKGEEITAYQKVYGEAPPSGAVKP